MYEGISKSGKSLIVLIPYSKIYPSGKGWVDLTEMQIDLSKSYSCAITVFCLENKDAVFVDLKKLYGCLTEESKMENSREGVHWKLDIFSNEISVRNGGGKLLVHMNDISQISGITNEE